VRQALLVGVALNPMAILLVCQHGNSDVHVGLFVTLALAALVVYRRSRDVLVWLGACLFLGLGVLAKPFRSSSHRSWPPEPGSRHARARSSV
jgi:4-amino-4-deoxy-L-arabinose transferase-like glycosyltransferase